MTTTTRRLIALALSVCVATGAYIVVTMGDEPSSPSVSKAPERVFKYERRKDVDTSGFMMLLSTLKPWDQQATLPEIAASFDRLGFKGVEMLDRTRASRPLSTAELVELLFYRSTSLSYEGQPRAAYKNLSEARALAEGSESVAQEWRFTLIFCQGVAALRIGEDENCIACRGESSCIIPIAPSAVHTKPEGSRLAIQHFTEYLEQFPDDFGTMWLLNLAHMTLGEFPEGVDARYRLPLDGFFKSEFDIGRFRDIGHLVGVNRLNQAGGAIMDDFDGDGLLDIVVTTMDATQAMAFYRNKGDGTFEERTKEAGLEAQLGGLNCVQTDYNNDGAPDIFICRGAWMPMPMRPSLLRNNRNGTFTDVTEEAGLIAPANSISATWADYDNDGHLDVFVVCERQSNRLYRNLGYGKFEEVAWKSNVESSPIRHGKGAAWLDYDNDGWPDLFVNFLSGAAQLFHNERNGKFSDATAEMAIDGPFMGFSCWAFDFDNDGFLDIFATSYDRSLEGAIQGLTGRTHSHKTSKLYRNLDGKRFQDVTQEAGLDKVYVTMGSNFADFDNDGYLDFYLGTGDPGLSMLRPNRMLKNVAGKRFADISTSSGTGHLQKGHGVACGDWNRDGNVDLFIEMGGAVNGDKYHNILFQNPGHDNNWLTIKLIGKKSNRAAIGARIRVVTDGTAPSTLHRHISSGSSFGANPLEQTIGLGKASRVATLEITWPTSGTKQVFKNVSANQMIEIVESETEYRRVATKPIAVPKP